MTASLATVLAWNEGALCVGVDLNFFPRNKGITPEVRAMCGACPVRVKCLGYAVDHGLQGIWGGTSEAQRATLGKRVRR